jgi:hypothetical protein
MLAFFWGATPAPLLFASIRSEQTSIDQILTADPIRPARFRPLRSRRASAVGTASTADAGQWRGGGRPPAVSGLDAHRSRDMAHGSAC